VPRDSARHLRGAGGRPRRVEHDEVVAEAVHLGELELHGARITLRSLGDSSSHPLPWPRSRIFAA
jgi:hypothetical protein